MADQRFKIPGAAWTHHFDEPLDQVRGPRRMPPLPVLLKMLPMIARLMRFSHKHKNTAFDPINLSPQPLEPYQGVPLGGIGAGSIGRGWRGEFRRWQLRPGHIQNEPVWADQFSLYVKREGQPATAQVLFPTSGYPRQTNGPLKAWNWHLPEFCATYQALFPRAWTTYDEPQRGLQLVCRQLSPVIAHNYQESSLPACEFRWQIENTGPQPVTVGLMFTFQNGMGTPNDRQGEHGNHVFQVDGISGVALNHVYRQREISDKQPASQRLVYEDPLTFAIAALPPSGGEVTHCARFVTSGDGLDIWSDFAADGKLENEQDPRPSALGETIGAGLAVRVRILPGEMREIAFSLAWDMPIIRFGAGTPYVRHYTRLYGAGSAPIFGSEISGTAARMAADVLLHAKSWETLIEKWQSPILEDESLPLWYRTALFNELYYLVDGGVVWAHPVDNASADPEMGHFAYLEGHAYRLYNTYDVHFYASFALAQLWPRLELALQRDIAAATLAESADTFKEMYSGKTVRRKVRGAVPHDLGWPDEDPWIKPNGYFIHDVNHWKDLNPKFVLQVYRDYLATGDRAFVRETWAAVVEALARVQRFDRDGDGLIENDGSPDQTYDVWPVKGPSAYSAGLWLAALAAGAELARLVGQTDTAAAYCQVLEQGQKAYEGKLWNGRYYNYDSSTSRQHDSIMADQLAGQWYTRACGLASLLDPLRARSALATVYDWNVMRFNDGQMGAVNGMRPDGQVDTTSLQSQEVWSGTTYAVAAAMLQEGMSAAAFKTAEGVYKMTYERTGYWFQTPEAWDGQGNFRAICDMRPLAIWAMQWAIDKKWQMKGEL